MARRTDSAAQARRLLALLPMLHQGETVAVADLAAAVGASPEVVAADLATLTLCGVPPFTPFDMIDLDLDGEAVTVYLEPPAIDRPLRLTVSEARALTAALEAAGCDPDGVLFSKLLAAASPAVAVEEIEHTVRTSTVPGGVADIYMALAIATDTHEKVRIEYLTGATGRQSDRVVHPWALVNRFGAWYLVAYCETSSESRVFRVDRIRSAERCDEYFEPPAGVPLDVTPGPGGLPVAEVLIRSGARSGDDRTWPGATFLPQADGTTLVRIPYQTPEWIARRVVARLGTAEALGPEEVREAVRALATRLLAELDGSAAEGAPAGRVGLTAPSLPSEPLA